MHLTRNPFFIPCALGEQPKAQSMNRPHTMTCALGEQPKAQRKNRRKNTGIVIRGLMARTNPDNWPIQEVHTLDEIIADRSISIQHIGESFHASDR